MVFITYCQEVQGKKSVYVYVCAHARAVVCVCVPSERGELKQMWQNVCKC